MRLFHIAFAVQIHPIFFPFRFIHVYPTSIHQNLHQSSHAASDSPFLKPSIFLKAHLVSKKEHLFLSSLWIHQYRIEGGDLYIRFPSHC